MRIVDIHRNTTGIDPYIDDNLSPNPAITWLNSGNKYTKIELTVDKKNPGDGLTASISYDLKHINSPSGISNAIILNLPWCNNYGHATHDVISWLLHYDTYSIADKLYTRQSPLVSSIIKQHEIKLKRVVFVDKKTTLESKRVEIHNFPCFCRRDINVIQNLYNKIHNQLNITQPKNCFIYCSRNHDPSIVRRKMVSVTEQKIIELSKKYCEINNLKFVLFTGMLNNKRMPLSNQINIFTRGKIVVGPHGAAMSNIFYLRDDHKPHVCEFVPGLDSVVDSGRNFKKNQNACHGYIFSRFADYCLIPFTADSTLDMTNVDVRNFKKYLETIKSETHTGFNRKI